MSDRRFILDLLNVNARATVWYIAARMSHDQELDPDFRRRVGYALGWLRRAEMVRPTRIPELSDGVLWEITDEGRWFLAACNDFVVSSHR